MTLNLYGLPCIHCDGQRKHKMNCPWLDMPENQERQMSVRMTRGLHHRIVKASIKEGMSPTQFITSVVAEYLRSSNGT